MRAFRLLFFASFAFIKSNCMEVVVSSSGFDIMRYYHHENKELNLSNIPIGDDGLPGIIPEIKKFIESIGVERLILENVNLSTVPFGLIGYALVSKTLKYVSFLGNSFSLTKQSDCREMPDGRGRSDSLVAQAISTVWGNLSPQIEKIIKEHNSDGSKFHYYNKIIFIDKSMPPITILDSYRRPYTKAERVKYIMVRVGLFGLGVIVTFLPSIIPWIVGEAEDNPLNSTSY